jgi:gliding motility-associated-like protein
VHDLKEKKLPYDNPTVNCFAYNVEMLGANEGVTFTSKDAASNYYNYFIGTNKSHHAANVKSYANVIYTDLYNGINLSAYSQQNYFKYDFIVRANADVNQIRLLYTGVTPKLNSSGDLIIKTSLQTFTEMAPYAYQLVNGQKVKVPCNFKLRNNVLTYEFPKGYNKNVELIIDPVMVYKTYSGSSSMTFGFSATYDLNGNLYAGGECFGASWPVTTGAFQTTFGGGVDAGINVYNTNGTALLYSTYFGGSSSDLPNSMIVNTNNELIICGTSGSTNLPVSAGAFDGTANGANDIYLARFNSTGTALLACSYIGGSLGDGSNDHEINIDNTGNLIVASSTFSTNFPTTIGAYQTVSGGGGEDGIVFKINQNLDTLFFSTYLGGSNGDEAKSVLQNSAGNYVVCGNTSSPNFPTTGGVINPTFLGGFTDGFVAELNNAGSAVNTSTFLGTIDQDFAFRIQIDASNNDVYICGRSDSYFITPGVYSNVGGNVFIHKINQQMTTTYLSTRIGDTIAGGFGSLSPAAFLLDVCNNLYVSCLGGSPTVPITSNAYQSATGGFWLCVLTPGAAALSYATYMGVPGDHIDGGSSRFDPQGIVYQSVCTSSTNDYNSVGAWSPSNMAGSWDVASFKFNFEMIGVNALITGISAIDSGCAPYNVTFNNGTTGAVTHAWDFGDGDTSTIFSPNHTYALPGVYPVRLIATNPSADCFAVDTAYTTITVVSNVNGQFTNNATLGCNNSTVQFNLIDSLQGPNVTILWSFGDGNTSNVLNPLHTYALPGIYTVKCVASNGVCKDSMSTVLDLSHFIDAIYAFKNLDDSLCTGELVSADGSASQVLADLTFNWNWGDGNISTTKPLGLHVYPNAGTYSILLTVTDKLGCIDSMRKNMFIAAHGLAVTPTDTQMCIGDRFMAYAYSSGTSTTPSISWSPSSGLLCNNCWTNEVAPVSNTTYNIIRTDQFNCLDTATLNVKVNPLPTVTITNGDSLFVPYNNEVILNAVGAYVYNWSPSWALSTTNQQSTIAKPKVSELYFVNALDTNGCKGSDSIYLNVNYRSPIFIANAFTPNGDGINDYFEITNLKFQSIQEFRIFNRWGNEVFNTNNAKGWNGTINGKDAPIDTYHYIIRLAFPDGFVDSYKGTFELIR